MNTFKILGALSLAFALLQSTPTCYGQFDLLYVGGANGTFDNAADWDGGFKPEFQFANDSLTFGSTPAGGATVDNDLDPANNGGVPLQVGLGSAPDGTAGGGIREDSAGIHFLDGSGDFTLTGFPIQFNGGTSSTISAIRTEPNAGTTQTINNDLVLDPDFANAGNRIVMLNTGAGGKVVLNGNITYNDAQWFFGDTFLDSPAVLEFNGTSNGPGRAGAVAQSWATGSVVSHTGGNQFHTVGRINAGDLQRADSVGGTPGTGTIEGANGTTIIAGSNSAFGDAHSGSWATNDLQYRSITSTRVERFNDGYADNNTLSTNSASVDLSEYGLGLRFGANWNYRSDFDTTIGWLDQIWGREDLNATMDNYPNPNHPTHPGRDIQPHASLTVDGPGTLTVAAHGGIFVSHYDGAEQFDIRLPGTSGEVAGANGRMVVDGKLYNSFMAPSVQTSLGTLASGGIEPGPKVPQGDAVLQLFIKPGQMVAEDGSLTNGTITVSYGTITLNGDSGNTWKGSQYRALNGSTTIIGHDNALGDAGSLVSIEDGSTVDTGTNTVAQKFINTDGTIRGNGTLTNAEDWSIAGTVQPGGETPSGADTMTFDFSGAGSANSVALESSSTLSIALDAGGTNSSVSVVGSPSGTSVDLNGGDVAFNDLTGGTVAAGVYTLIDGDANTTISATGTSTSGLPANHAWSEVSVAGDDLVLSYANLGGDATLSDTVDVADLGILATNWQQPGGFTDGNFDLAGVVDVADLGTLATNWQLTFPAAAAAVAVPEPAALMLLTACLGACGVRRRLVARK